MINRISRNCLQSIKISAWIMFLLSAAQIFASVILNKKLSLWNIAVLPLAIIFLVISYPGLKKVKGQEGNSEKEKRETAELERNLILAVVGIINGILILLGNLIVNIFWPQGEANIYMTVFGCALLAEMVVISIVLVRKYEKIKKSTK